ncbi:regulator of Vps4 activity in the MVB pathway-domain-containing protein [Aspergillus pseudodeflectus]|uniref:Regulator of Vps4 activity in the MVB pathway-domain-containing protein n=1 Tax=Aspergillus pseudodeflectus TaxID=176178 RepID=A0ABR4JW17_9EURO
MPPSPQTAKLTSTLHLLIPRLRLLQKKSTASSVVQRRDLASLLENNRDASARIRVENVIATDIAIEVMEMVELYCELLLARAGVLDQLAFGEAGQRMRVRVRDEAVAYNHARGKGAMAEDPKPGGGGGGLFGFFGGKKAAQAQAQPQPQQQAQGQDQPTPSDSEAAVANSGDTFYLDPALDEAATAIFYAWSRFPSEVRELTLLRSLLADRYGKDYMTLASENKLADIKVPERLVKGLRVRPPSAELVESYLIEIARAYKVQWGEDTDADDQEVDAVLEEVLAGGDDVDGNGNGDGGEVGELVRRASETAELTRATPPRGLHADKLSGKSPVSVAPPGPRSDNPNPRVKVPDDKNAPTEVPSPSPAQRAGRDKSGIPEVDELSRRFAALKR